MHVKPGTTYVSCMFVSLADDMFVSPDVYIDLTKKNPNSISLFCQNADRPQWYRGAEVMLMNSKEECRQMSLTKDYVCPGKLFFAKPSARHAGVYTCKDMAHRNRFKTVYVQSIEP